MTKFPVQVVPSKPKTNLHEWATKKKITLMQAAFLLEEENPSDYENEITLHACGPLMQLIFSVAADIFPANALSIGKRANYKNIRYTTKEFYKEIKSGEKDTCYKELISAFANKTQLAADVYMLSQNVSISTHSFEKWKNQYRKGCAELLEEHGGYPLQPELNYDPALQWKCHRGPKVIGAIIKWENYKPADIKDEIKRENKLKELRAEREKLSEHRIVFKRFPVDPEFTRMMSKIWPDLLETCKGAITAPKVLAYLERRIDQEDPDVEYRTNNKASSRTGVIDEIHYKDEEETQIIAITFIFREEKKKLSTKTLKDHIRQEIKDRNSI